jgi:hypothetical protein
MRKELRIRHDDWMRKIQEAADVGKIGRMMKKKKNLGGFSLFHWPMEVWPVLLQHRMFGWKINLEFS